MDQSLFKVNISAVTKFLLTKTGREHDAWQEWESRIFGEEVALENGQAPITEGSHQVVICILHLVHAMVWSFTSDAEKVNFETAQYVRQLDERMKQHERREKHFTSACLFEEMSSAIEESLFRRMSPGAVVIIGGNPFEASPFGQYFPQFSDSRPLGRFSILRVLRRLRW